MAARIIILGSSINSVFLTANCVFWYPITSGQKATTGVSAWPGASAAENAAIQNGSILEETITFPFPTGLPVPNLQAFLLQYWTNRNAQINGVGPGLYANAGYDSVSGWINVIT